MKTAREGWLEVVARPRQIQQISQQSHKTEGLQDTQNTRLEEEGHPSEVNQRRLLPVDVDQARRTLSTCCRAARRTLGMPGQLDGIALARAFCTRDPGALILFTSGFANPTGVDAAIKALGAELISKPYRKADLAARLRRILNRGVVEADCGAAR